MTNQTKKRLLLLSPLAALLLLLTPRKLSNGVVNTSLSRGLRNNNPGALRKTEIPWNGKVDNPKDKDFETFDTMSNGVRAAIKNAYTQWNRGKDTISTLVSVWAPAHENNTAAYVAKVAKAAKIGPDKEFKFGNNEITANIMYAILRHESGAELPQYVTLSDVRQRLAALYPSTT